jgi:hypothetical protein
VTGPYGHIPARLDDSRPVTRAGRLPDEEPGTLLIAAIGYSAVMTGGKRNLQNNADDEQNAEPHGQGDAPPAGNEIS